MSWRLEVFLRCFMSEKLGVRGEVNGEGASVMALPFEICVSFSADC